MVLKNIKKMNQKLNPISSSTYIEYKGLDNISSHNTSVYLSNHVSIEDISLLDGALPQDVHLFIEEKEALHNKNVLKYRKYSKYKELNNTVYQEMCTLLANGISIFFFPEENISPNGITMPISEEIGSFFKQNCVPAYPIHIAGGAYIKSSRFKEDALKLTENIVVSVGDAFYPCKEEEAERLSTIQVSQRIYTQLHDEAYRAVAKEKTNLYNLFVDRIRLHDQDDKGVYDEQTFLPYKQFLVSTSVLGIRFEKILEGEERIGTLLPTSIGYALTLFGLFKTGKTPVILNFTMGIHNLIGCCETAGLQTILTSKAFVKQAQLDSVVDALSENYRILYLEDIKSKITSGEKLLGLTQAKRFKKIKSGNDEIIFFTSGSENIPKGVVLSHDNIVANIHQMLVSIHLSPKDKIMNVMPMFHSFGMTAGCLLPILHGVDLFLFPSPISYKKIPKLIYKHQSTVLFGTPTFFLNYGKAAEKHHMNTIRYAVSGAEKLKDEVNELWHKKFGIRIMEGYGVTETSPVLSLNRPYTHENESVGQLLPNMSYLIEPVEGIPNGGNLLVKGPNIMKGYLIHGKGFLPQEGWYRTGDVVELNETEHIFIKARLKRFAKLGGEMVSLNAVEQIASECFGHADFAAVSIPDKRKGEKIILFTTTEDMKDRALKKHIKEQKQSNLMIPYKLEQIEAIPLLGPGKTDYLRLTKIAAEMFGK